MRFGPVAVKDALGTILAHSVPAAGLAKGIMLRDGMCWRCLPLAPAM